MPSIQKSLSIAGFFGHCLYFILYQLLIVFMVNKPNGQTVNWQFSSAPAVDKHWSGIHCAAYATESLSSLVIYQIRQINIS